MFGVLLQASHLPNQTWLPAALVQLVPSVTLKAKRVAWGTSNESARNIVIHGFDNRITSRGLYGCGVYFAASGCKANQYSCTMHKPWKGFSKGCTCQTPRRAWNFGFVDLDSQIINLHFFVYPSRWLLQRRVNICVFRQVCRAMEPVHEVSKQDSMITCTDNFHGCWFNDQYTPFGEGLFLTCLFRPGGPWFWLGWPLEMLITPLRRWRTRRSSEDHPIEIPMGAMIQRWLIGAPCGITNRIGRRTKSMWFSHRSRHIPHLFVNMCSAEWPARPERRICTCHRLFLVKSGAIWP